VFYLFVICFLGLIFGLFRLRGFLLVSCVPAGVSFITSYLSLLVALESLDTSNLNITLEAPPLPLPKSMVDQILLWGVAELIPLVNWFLSTYPMTLPEITREYLPRPRFSSLSQPVPESPTHGYLEFMSSCTCGSRGVDRCNFPCSLNKAETSTVVMPEKVQQQVVPVFQTTPATWFVLPESRRQLAQTFPGLDNQVDFQGLYLSFFARGDCSLSQVGDWSVSVFAPFTTSCGVLHLELPGSSAPTMLYYSYGASGAVSSNELWLCSLDCGLCFMNVSAIDSCRVSSSSDFQMSILTATTPASGSCFGSSASSESPSWADSYLWVEFPSASECTTQAEQVAVMNQLSASASRSITHLGSGSECSSLTGLDLSFLFRQPSSRVFGLTMYCNEDCDAESCDYNLPDGLPLHVCSPNVAGTEYGFLMAATSLITCAAAPEPSPQIDAISVLVIAVLVVAALATFGLLWVGCKHRSQIEACLRNVLVLLEQMVAATSAFFSGLALRMVCIWKASFGKFQLGCEPVLFWEGFEVSAVLFLLVNECVSTVAWLWYNPWQSLEEYLGSDYILGISREFLDVSLQMAECARWRAWSELCCYVLLGTYGLVFLARYAIRAPCTKTDWRWLRVGAVVLAIFMKFLLLMGPGLFSRWVDNIVVVYTGMPDTTTADLASFAMGSLFAGYGTSVTASIFIPAMDGLSAGVFLMCSFLIAVCPYRLADLTRVQVAVALIAMLTPVSVLVPVMMQHQMNRQVENYLYYWMGKSLLYLIAFFNLTRISISLRAGTRDEATRLATRNAYLFNTSALFVFFFASYVYLSIEMHRFQLFAVEFNVFTQVYFFVLGAVLAYLLMMPFEDMDALDTAVASKYTESPLVQSYIPPLLASVAVRSVPVFDPFDFTMSVQTPAPEAPPMARSVHTLAQSAASEPCQLVLTATVPAERSVRRSWVSTTSARVSTALQQAVTNIQTEEVRFSNTVFFKDPSVSGDSVCRPPPAQLPTCASRCPSPLAALIAWLLETRERSQPALYGQRVMGRRLFLVVGMACGYYLSLGWVELLQTSARDQMVAAAASFGLALSFPQAERTVLDNGLDAYERMRFLSFVCFMAAVGLFSCMLLMELLCNHRKALRIQRYFGMLGALCMAAAAIFPIMPDYAKLMGLHELVPFCAPDFNLAAQTTIDGSIGLGLGVYFTVMLFPLLVTTMFALLKGVLSMMTTLMLTHDISRVVEPGDAHHPLVESELVSCQQSKPSSRTAAAIMDAHKHSSKTSRTRGSTLPRESFATVVLDSDAPLPAPPAPPPLQPLLEVDVSKDLPQKAEAPALPPLSSAQALHLNNLRFLIMFLCILSPFIVAFPLVLLAQVARGWARYWILAFIFVPILFGYPFAMSKTVRELAINFNVWNLLYLAPLVVIGLHTALEVTDFSTLWTQFGYLFEDPRLYATFVFDIGLSVIVVSDVLYHVFGE